MEYKRKNRVLTSVLAGFLGFAVFTSNHNSIVTAEETTMNNESYAAFFSKNHEKVYNGSNYSLDALDSVKESVETNNQDMIFLPNQGQIEMNIEAPEDGLYYLGFNYLIDNTSILPTSVQIKINDELPFPEMQNLQFYSLWQREKEAIFDRYNNEIAPDIHKITDVQLGMLEATNGYYAEPMAVFLEKGNNTLSMTSVEGDMWIQSIELFGENDITHKNLSEDQTENVSGDSIIELEAEMIDFQNSSSIRPSAVFNDRLTPYNSEYRVLNFLDGDSFSNVGDEIIYEFNVEEEGLYHISLHYQQDSRVDFPVFLTTKINNEVPSESLLTQPVPYSTTYSVYTFQNKETDEKLPVYLEAGENQISFKLNVDPVSNVLRRSETLIKEIQGLSLQIENLLGSNVDRNRDIDLERYIPGVENHLLGWADELKTLQEEVKKIAKIDFTPGAFSHLSIAEDQLRDLASEPRRIPNRWNELARGGASVTANLATLLQEATNNGLSIDTIYIHQTEEIEPSGAGFFERVINSGRRFIRSFTEQDYEVNPESENLQVWVNRPRQYIEIMQQMIDQDFTPQTGINVDLSIMPDQNKLILANSSDKEPDIALGVNYALPFDLAIRGALEDLTQYEGYDELSDMFSQNMFLPSAIGDSVYAFPETMNFYILFYRRDIMDSLGLEIPDTMNDLINMLPALNQRGMSAFYPTATLGTSFKIFPWTMPMVYQSGGNFYTESILQSGINTDETIEGMRNLTDLFTIYNMPVDVPNFYQQFRDGSVPIGISDYGSYNMILNAAPEIANLWDVALTPGMPNENGNVERWTSGGAESSIMFSGSQQKDNAWEFMKWWHSDDIQRNFGVNLQTTYGPEYLWNTANLKAFEELPWATTHKNVILEQSEWIAEVPRVLGSYMVEREVSRVYTSVVVDGETLRNSIDLSAKRINRETLRKLEEFGYYLDGEQSEIYPMPNVEREMDNSGN